MKKLANILLLFVMCFALVGCGKDSKKEETNLEEKAKESVTALAKSAQKYFVDRITKGEGFVWEMEATEVDVTEKPSAGTITFTPDPTADAPIVTVKDAKFGDYTCSYENETANCTK